MHQRMRENGITRQHYEAIAVPKKRLLNVIFVVFIPKCRQDDLFLYGLFSGTGSSRCAKFASSAFPAELIFGQVASGQSTTRILKTLREAWLFVDKQYLSTLNDLTIELVRMEFDSENLVSSGWFKSNINAFCNFVVSLERIVSLINSAGTLKSTTTLVWLPCFSCRRVRHHRLCLTLIARIRSKRKSTQSPSEKSVY